jgi:hypothetical protein
MMAVWQRLFSGSSVGSSPPSPAFVSYSYDDDAALRALMGLAGRRELELRPFRPITVPPSAMVSNELLSAIAACASLVFIDTETSRSSRWVALETDHARRIGKPVFAFNPRRRRLIRDASPALDLAVFPSLAGSDATDVRGILDLMRRERGFDVFIAEEDLAPGSNWRAESERGLQDRLRRGGYALLFWSASTAENKWVRGEFHQAQREFPAQVLPVMLDETPLSPELATIQAIRIRRVADRGFDMRDVDDVIVWLYWLIQARRDKR